MSWIHPSGYEMEHVVGRGITRVHILIAEKVLGKSLPSGVEVHHMDGNKANNRNNNLVICPSGAYHKLLHRRQEALEACGNANFGKCKYCKQWDDPVNLFFKEGEGYKHVLCRRQYHRVRYQNVVGKSCLPREERLE
jgi:hypothetical protein